MVKWHVHCEHWGSGDGFQCEWSLGRCCALCVLVFRSGVVYLLCSRQLLAMLACHTHTVFLQCLAYFLTRSATSCCSVKERLSGARTHSFRMTWSVLFLGPQRATLYWQALTPGCELGHQHYALAWHSCLWARLTVATSGSRPTLYAAVPPRFTTSGALPGGWVTG